jgi:acyl transferase domain-containing protein
MEHEENLEGVAIIGVAGRFPKASNAHAFWELIRDGKECVSFYEPEALVAQGIPEVIAKHPAFVPAGLLLEGLENFDPGFFSMTPGEARLVDPQHRLFMECCWEALEDAGYNPETYPGSIGVYGGCATNRYYTNNLLPNQEMMRLYGNFQALMNNDRDFLTTRVSYKLNLKGPSVDMQTACSTSLVAAGMAFQSLMNYQADMFLVGAAALDIPNVAGYLWQEGDILAKDGHCYAFDARAKGTLAGNGSAVLLLKRLEDAVEDGDHIYAVLRSVAINNDGANKVGYTAPSEEGQSAVIAEALELAEVEADDIGMVEAHGTATEIGDPIEIAALSRVYRETTDRTQYCAISSVKANVGHVDTAAGAVGLLKAALALKHGTIPPSPNFEKPNPKIDFEASPFFVPTKAMPWKEQKGPRRAAVSSFGIGGTNAHAILEEAPQRETQQTDQRMLLFPLSARDEKALSEARENLADHLEANPDLVLADVAYTLQVGRKGFNHRFLACAGDRTSLIKLLREGSAQQIAKHEVVSQDSTAVFMFPGQGAQYPGMARQLYQDETSYRDALDECLDILQRHMPETDLKALLLADSEDGTAAEQLAQTSVTQPALFAVSYALAKTWQAWGVAPKAMIGHSVGEYVAATLAGVFTLEAALEIVAMRGKLLAALPSGSMLAVPLSAADTELHLDDSVTIAALNGPKRTVVSGPTPAIEKLKERLQAHNIMATLLKTSHAFHSEMMQPAMAPFEKVFQNVTLSAPEIPFISNLTGDWIREDEATDARYWLQQLRQPVRFTDGMEKLSEEKVFIEVGPGATLSVFAKQCLKNKPQVAFVQSVRKINQKADDLQFFGIALGKAWAAGLQLDWLQGEEDHGRLRVSLPTYPFQRRRCWIDPPQKAINFHQIEAIAEAYDRKQAREKSNKQKEQAKAPIKPKTDVISIKDRLCLQVAKILDEPAEDLDLDDTFLELDASSFFLDEVRDVVNQTFGVKPSSAELMGATNTLNKLAAWIVREQTHTATAQ